MGEGGGGRVSDRERVRAERAELLFSHQYTLD